MSNHGLITLPAKLHQTPGLQANDQLIAATTPKRSLERPAGFLSLELYSPQRLQEFEAAERELAIATQRLET